MLRQTQSFTRSAFAFGDSHRLGASRGADLGGRVGRLSCGECWEGKVKLPGYGPLVADQTILGTILGTYFDPHPCCVTFVRMLIDFGLTGDVCRFSKPSL